MSTDLPDEERDLGAERTGCDTWGHQTETTVYDDDTTYWRCTACGAEGWDE